MPSNVGRGTPLMIYGTAWKEERTTDLVYQAVKSGFTALDTADNFRNYRQTLVGDALRQLVSENLIQRSQIFSKFSPHDNGLRDGYLSYSDDTDITCHVRTSVTESLKQLNPDVGKPIEEAYLDCVMLHTVLGSYKDTIVAWRALETFVPHPVHQIGLSNVSLPIFKLIYDAAIIKPAFVQNRFYPDNAFDTDMRSHCQDIGVQYQAYWVLKKNVTILKSKPVLDLVRKCEIASEAALMFLVTKLGNISVLNGTTSEETMRSDLQHFVIADAWINEAKNRAQWLGILSEFKEIVGDKV